MSNLYSKAQSAVPYLVVRSTGVLRGGLKVEVWNNATMSLAFVGKDREMYRWFDKFYPGWREGRAIDFKEGDQVRIDGELYVYKIYAMKGGHAWVSGERDGSRIQKKVSLKFLSKVEV